MSFKELKTLAILSREGCSGIGAVAWETLTPTDGANSEELKNNCLKKYGVFKK